MPSTVGHAPRTPTHVRKPTVASLTAALLAVLVAPLHGCASRDRADLASRTSPTLYPPPPQTPRVVALGSLRSGREPSRTRVALARFLFGTDPESALRLIRPAGLASNGLELLICDSALNATLRWDSAAGELSERRLAERPGRPVAVDVAPNGDLLIADVAASVVRRYDAAGNLLARYAPSSGEFRPADVLCVDQTVWVSNVRAHCIEVFDAQSGRHLRSIGGRGAGPGEFGMPLGMVRAPSGDVYVVDMLNGRVQVLDAEGNWLRDIGQPGDRVGCFGRPKDVAIGPDGTVFVSDAALQCVHAFAADGRPLLAFGQVVDGGGGLAVPAGIAVCRRSPIKDAPLPVGLVPAYYVLVAEQMRDPGLRVYAWLGSDEYPDQPTTPATSGEQAG